MADTSRQRVVRADGRTISVVQRRAHLSYCSTGCCCGKTERGYAAVPADTLDLVRPMADRTTAHP
jgi:cobaltochelatase CobN